MNEDATGEECKVIAGVESVPECTEEEDGHGAVYAVVDDKTQPVSCRTIPVVKQLFEAGA